MHSLNIYLDLQARIILRAFRNAGLVVSLVVMLVLAMVMLGLFYAPNQFVVLGGCFIVLMVRHQCRKDTPFLMTLFDERTMKLILMTEYIHYYITIYIDFISENRAVAGFIDDCNGNHLTDNKTAYNWQKPPFAIAILI